MKSIDFIFISVFALAVSLLSFTVYTAVSNPIEKENVYMDNYKNIDKNYKKIQKDISIFDKKINFKYKINKKSLQLFLSNDEYTCADFDIKVLLTRPHTNKDNMDLEPKCINDKATYNIDLPTLTKGRWKFIVKIKVDNLTAYKKIKLEI